MNIRVKVNILTVSAAIMAPKQDYMIRLGTCLLPDPDRMVVRDNCPCVPGREVSRIILKYAIVNYRLDGVGPVDNRPSTDKPHHFVKKKKKKKRKM